MKIQINTDANTEGNEALSAQIERTVESAFGRKSDHITRVKVHLNNVNSHKSSYDNKRCIMKARIEGSQPIAVTNRASTMDQAIDSAADRSNSLIDSALGRKRDQRNRRTAPPPPDQMP